MMKETEKLITEFRAALAEEIDFIKNQGGGSKFTARNGQLIEDSKCQPRLWRG